MVHLVGRSTKKKALTAQLKYRNEMVMETRLACDINLRALAITRYSVETGQTSISPEIRSNDKRVQIK